MRTAAILIGLSVLVLGSVTPASAEFWGCKDDRGKVLAEWTTDSHGRVISGKRYSHDYTARARHKRVSYGARRHWNERRW